MLTPPMRTTLGRYGGRLTKLWGRVGLKAKSRACIGIGRLVKAQRLISNETIAGYSLVQESVL